MGVGCNNWDILGLGGDFWDILGVGGNYWDTLGVGGNYHPIPQGFSSLLLKPYIKGVTHSQEVSWWRTLMVECVTLFRLFSPIKVVAVQMGL